MQTLRGRTALLTGASRGIGREIARALAAEGVNLLLSARTAASLEQTLREARAEGVEATPLPADLGDRAEVERLAQAALDAAERIDILVNNAAIERAWPFERVALDFIEEITAVNLIAPMLLTRLLLPHMIARGEGHVVHVSSLAGLVGTPYDEPYSATKHGLVGFSRSLRLTLQAEGRPIGMSVICPAFVEDDGMYQSAADASGAPAPAMLGTVAMARVGRAVVRAIRKDQAEVILTGKPTLPFRLTQTVAPEMAERMSSMVGVPAMFRKWADASLRVAGDGAARGA